MSLPRRTGPLGQVLSPACAAGGAGLERHLVLHGGGLSPVAAPGAWLLARLWKQPLEKRGPAEKREEKRAAHAPVCLSWRGWGWHAAEHFRHSGLMSAVLGVAMRRGGGRLCASWGPLFGAGLGRARIAGWCGAAGRARAVVAAQAQEAIPFNAWPIRNGGPSRRISRWREDEDVHFILI